MSEPPSRDSLRAHLASYIERRKARHKTWKHDERAILRLVEACEAEGLTELHEVTPERIEAYHAKLVSTPGPSGRILSPRTRYQRISMLRCFFRDLVRQGELLDNPVDRLDLRAPKPGLYRLPLAESEMERVLEGIDTERAIGIRDRAILELFYSTGLRRAELRALRLYDIDAGAGLVTVRLGKGRKDRVVPIGDRALFWLGRYLQDVRADILTPPDDQTVFLNRFGRPLSAHGIGLRVRLHVEAAGIQKPGSPHVLRHTAATVMLERGADVRLIGAFLGHESLATTQRYTHVSKARLKAEHTRTHPAETAPQDDSEDV